MTSIHNAVADGKGIDEVIKLYHLNDYKNVPKFIHDAKEMTESVLEFYCTALNIDMNELQRYDTLMIVYYLDGTLMVQNWFPKENAITSIGTYRFQKLDEVADKIASNSHLPANAAVLYYGNNSKELENRIKEKIIGNLVIP